MAEPRTTPQTDFIKWVPQPKLMKRIGRWHTTLYRLTGGWIGGRMDGLDILLLTTLGRKTGIERTVPLPYFRDGSRYVLIASYGGNAKNPAWLDNIAANRDVSIAVGFRRMKARATIAEDAERDRLWTSITTLFPRYLEYQKKTARRIPVVVIEP
jgi:deazaflavin-dependent oxidoreductase (nitroreductase family)